MVTLKCNNGFLLLCCTATKCYSLLLTIKRIKYYERVCSLALVFWHANCIIFGGVSACTIFSHFNQQHDFGENFEPKMPFDFLCKFYLKSYAYWTVHHLDI